LLEILLVVLKVRVILKNLELALIWISDRVLSTEAKMIELLRHNSVWGCLSMSLDWHVLCWNCLVWS